MADELDPKNPNQNEEMGRTSDEDVRDQADNDEEFEDIEDEDSEDEDDAVDAESQAVRPPDDKVDVHVDTTQADVGNEAGETWRPTDEEVEPIVRDENADGRRSP